MAMKSSTSTSCGKMILHEDIARYTITQPSAILDSNYSFICFAKTSCDNTILFHCLSCKNRVEHLDRQTIGIQSMNNKLEVGFKIFILRLHGFRSNRSTTDAIFVLRQLLENTRRVKEPMFIAFVALKAAFDWIPRDALFKF